ncbi:ABC transporter ATP-binding protein [Parapedobacter sp. ISTM3]|uniref:ATP-binding cassette, subfamily B, MsbA n=1 Tax=Parapedobacter luteus TaxID=623280 RepID=A0A1T5EZH6_9SPHI|nr:MULTISPECIES: ABC transporter ATP-binding protein [Parapedobacter]MBK1439319.1 ABC transporter ATP-binding protein [Parapedobacter sp. ISTM3]SKB89374.1 ATP-binding cassette, subfamily B, MsbA [Parapedobacter luteus]
MKTYFRLLSYAKPIEKFAIPYVLCTLLSVVFSTLNLALVIPLLHTLFNTNGTAAEVAKPENWYDVIDYFNYYATQAGLLYGPYEALKRVCLIIVVSVFLSNLFRYLSQRIMENLRIHTLLNLRKAVFDNVMDLHVGYFNSQRKGDIISKIASDVQVVQFSVTGTLQVVFKEPLTLVFYIIALFLISTELTLFAVAVIPLSAFLISRIVKRLKAQAIRAQQVYGNMIAYLDEALSGVKIIKAFNATDFIKKKFNDENILLSKISRRMVRRQQLGSPVSELLGVVMVAVILLYGGNLVLSGSDDLSAAAFIGYIALFSQVMRPAKALTDSFANIHSGIAAGERVLDLIDQKNELPDAPAAKPLTAFNQGIRLVDVSFSYGDRQVLKAINLEIPKGKTVALVGPSGGGKSTLMDLIPRFIDVKEGEVLLDGVNVKNLKTSDLRSLIGLVNQDSFLFNDTIYNNIAFAAEHVQLDDVIAAAKIANAHEFILDTEKGYDTYIGDRGIRLSGGQRQRICIARAVLKNPPILLLDEATSALDTESEKLVQEALGKLMENRTTLVIAHRLSTIQNADKIVVLESGHIVEEGTHQQLLAKGGLYKKLIDMQQFGE